MCGKTRDHAVKRGIREKTPIAAKRGIRSGQGPSLRAIRENILKDI
jgi:hypothetical protein